MTLEQAKVEWKEEGPLPSEEIRALSVEKTIGRRMDELSEEKLISVLIKQLGISHEEAKSAITDAMMMGLVYKTREGTFDRTGWTAQAEWE